LDPRDSFHGECYPILKKILTFEIEAMGGFAIWGSYFDEG
jgi:hypothetical protein